MANSEDKPQTREIQKKPETSKIKEKVSIRKISGLRLKESIWKNLGIQQRDIDAFYSFVDLSDQEKVAVSRKIIQDSIIDASKNPDFRFAYAIAESEKLIQGYSTLDDQHREDIKKLINKITVYLNDSTRKRPLNVLMLAAPGAGKSHFIKQLAKTMKNERVQAVTFNMATMQSTDDMAQPVDELRNLKVNDQFPLLFLDEFDSDPSRYALLLPILWDGEFQIGHRDLKLGKAVIVLAGSNPDLPKAMDQSAKMRLDMDATERFVATSKLVDLLSRINGGVINIPDLDLRTYNRDRRVDKVCIAVALLRTRFGNDLKVVPRSLLRFIAHTSFRYGVRSIAHLIDMIGKQAFQKNALKSDKLDLPFANEEKLQGSDLKLHFLDKDQGFGIVNRWKEFKEDVTVVELTDTTFNIPYDYNFARG